MKKNQYFLCFFIFIFCFASWASESGYLYNLSDKNRDNISIFYDFSSNKYIVKNILGEFTYDRRNFERMLSTHESTIPFDDRLKVRKAVTEHAKVTIASNPSLEEVVDFNIISLKNINSYLETKISDCYDSTSPRDGISLNINKENEQSLTNLQLENEGFVLLGKLESVKLELLSSNDNPLHGALGAAGITSWASGIEGDDRGKTFGYDLSATAKFEKGEVSVRKTSTGYGRLKPKDGNKYMYNGQVYTSKIYNDEDGKRYQEFLSIDSTEIEIKRLIGQNDIYLKVIGRQKVMDDTSGDSKDIQTKWHKSTKDSIKDGGIEYHYLDYMKKRSGVEAYVEVEKQVKLFSSNDLDISSSTYAGVQTSELGSSERFAKVGGEVKVVFNDNQESKKFPSWEVRMYAQAKRYDDKETGHLLGASVAKNFSITKNSVVYIKAGVDYNHDRYSVEYGQEEIKRHGRLDIDHQLGIGFEYKFK